MLSKQCSLLQRFTDVCPLVLSTLLLPSWQIFVAVLPETSRSLKGCLWLSASPGNGWEMQSLRPYPRAPESGCACQQTLQRFPYTLEPEKHGAKTSLSFESTVGPAFPNAPSYCVQFFILNQPCSGTRNSPTQPSHFIGLHGWQVHGAILPLALNRGK